MSASVHAPYCADHSVQVQAPVREMERVARDTYRIRVEAPEIAARTVPGQFIMLRMAGISDPLIGRALAVYDIFHDGAGQPLGIDVVFVAKGKLTTALVGAGRDAEVFLWGPLGNGFATTPADHLVMAVGGIGQTPMLLLGDEALGNRAFGSPPRTNGYAKRVTMVYGARSGDLLASLDAFAGCGIDLQLCTDDGSRGQQGRVPDVLAEVLDRARGESPNESIRVVTCGPEIMMEKVAEVTAARGVPCQVSLETPMACGIGICFTCVTKVRQEDGEWDYKRTCVEGPIFDAKEIVW